jgi:hypothetical protein
VLKLERVPGWRRGHGAAAAASLRDPYRGRGFRDGQRNLSSGGDWMEKTGDVEELKTGEPVLTKNKPTKHGGGEKRNTFLFFK